MYDDTYIQHNSYCFLIEWTSLLRNVYLNLIIFSHIFDIKFCISAMKIKFKMENRLLFVFIN